MFKLATKVNPKLTIAARLETHYYDTLLKDLVILNYKHSPELKQPLLDVDVRDIFTKPLKDIPTSKSTVSNLLSLPVTAKRTRKWTSLIYNPIDYTNVTKERMIEFEKKSVPIESIKLVDSIPRIQKISLRIWNETAIGNKNMVFSAIMALSAISGVRAEPLFAAKGDANKKIRQGMPLVYII